MCLWDPFGTFPPSSIVRNFDILKSLGVTHIVNASHGKKLNQTNTDAAYYKGDNIAFYGIPALDILTYKILPYLRPAASFMHDALLSNGKEMSVKVTLWKCCPDYFP